MSQMGRHKLRNVIFHKFLDRIRHLGQAPVAPIIIPLNDFYSRSRFRLSFNPFCDLFVGGAGGDEILELVGRDFRKTEKEVVERAVEVILTCNSRERCPALVQRAGGDDIASDGLPRASWEVLGEILPRFFTLFVSIALTIIGFRFRFFQSFRVENTLTLPNNLPGGSLVGFPHSSSERLCPYSIRTYFLRDTENFIEMSRHPRAFGPGRPAAKPTGAPEGTQSGVRENQ